ncbi:MAG: riboflavin synthase [bacterium]|nr:riboflavin synthase [bacterium]
MFTGLIETLGKIKQKGRNFLVVEMDFNDVEIGDSMAVNGVCLTVVHSHLKALKLDVMPETFKSTNFDNLKTGDFVNIERAMLASSRFNGHIVQGHVESVGILQKIETRDNAKVLTIHSTLGNIYEKGSIAIDGISLTVFSRLKGLFSVSIIPETWRVTNLMMRRIGDKINIETDFLTKQTEKKKDFYNLLKDEGFM